MHVQSDGTGKPDLCNDIYAERAALIQHDGIECSTSDSRSGEAKQW